MCRSSMKTMTGRRPRLFHSTERVSRTRDAGGIGGLTSIFAKHMEDDSRSQSQMPSAGRSLILVRRQRRMS
jgi:hypothetical protein